MRPGPLYPLEVNPRLPPQLARLPELAGNLWYSWNRAARELFARLHPQLWDRVGHSPAIVLRYVDERCLVRAAQDSDYLRRYHDVLEAFDRYHADTAPRIASGPWNAGGPVAYFCAEFGLHESLPIYSGGLGILAGDCCKAASDMRLPFVGVGLLYRQGYFAQTIGRDGGQVVTYNDIHFTQLPAALVMSGTDELHVSVDLPGRAITLRIWHVQAGHVHLYLLDSDVPPNSGEDRGITYRLYGGDRTVRLEQEMVLGMGGARALAALGIVPSVWHINEGHAAFLILERARAAAQTMPYPAALESIAANTVFTTHTPVPAGHDQFDPAMMQRYFEGYCRDACISSADLLALGRHGSEPNFNMTALAVRGSRFRNAVSRIHGGVSARLLRDFWPQVPPEENPIDYVTNAVHVPTFLAPEWAAAFERLLGCDWFERICHGEGAAHILQMPDDAFWAVHQKLKSHMLELLRHRICMQHLRNGGSEARLAHMLRLVDPANPQVLTIGFARRFATYKRADLVLKDLQRLGNIIGRADQPVVFVFAGKAHPADEPGQEIIREISRVARLPEFEDKIFMLEGYDLHVARRLVSGVDVWLNNPVYPLEASGTSGMKAGMNGVLNLSVRDGWWDEGFEPGNGWAITTAAEELDPQRRNLEESRALYELLHDQVIPAYYARGENGLSPAWLRMAKKSIATLLPQFSATRMVDDYVRKLYRPAVEQAQRLDGSGQAAGELAAWKARVTAAWPQVAIAKPQGSAARLPYGETMRVEVEVKLAGLRPQDLKVEFLLERQLALDSEPGEQRLHFTPSGESADDIQRYALDVTPEFCGGLYYFVRVYPWHELLNHRFEVGLMRWA
jgi:starch phosphorylase